MNYLTVFEWIALLGLNLSASLILSYERFAKRHGWMIIDEFAKANSFISVEAFLSVGASLGYCLWYGPWWSFLVIWGVVAALTTNVIRTFRVKTMKLSLRGMTVFSPCLVGAVFYRWFFWT